MQRFFKEMKIVNFDLIKKNVSEERKKQYQQIDHHEIMGYPSKLLEEICSSIFRKVNTDGMYVKKETIDEYFKGVGKTNGTGPVRFIKKLGIVYMLRLGGFFIIFLCCIRKKINV